MLWLNLLQGLRLNRDDFLNLRSHRLDRHWSNKWRCLFFRKCVFQFLRLRRRLSFLIMEIRRLCLRRIIILSDRSSICIHNPLLVSLCFLLGWEKSGSGSILLSFSSRVHLLLSSFRLHSFLISFSYCFFFLLMNLFLHFFIIHSPFT